MEQFEKIKKTLPERKEKKKLLELDITFCFGPHWSEKDAQFLKENLKKVDIFSPELCGYRPEDVEDLNRLAQGDYSLLVKRLSSEEADEWAKIIYRLVFNSKKIILPVDVAESELAEDLWTACEMNNRATEQFLMGELKDAIETRKTCIKELANLHKKREKIILENIEKLPEKVCAEHPELRKKKKLKVLVFLGILHTSLYHEMKKKGRLAKEILITKPFIFSRPIEALRKERFLGLSQFDDEFFARSFLEDFLVSYFEKFSSDTTKNILAARIIASRANFDFIKKLSAELETRFMDSPSKLPHYIARYLREHKIEVPKNKKEFDKLIKNYLKR